MTLYFRWTASDDGRTIARQLGAQGRDGADVFHGGRSMYRDGHEGEEHRGRRTSSYSHENKIVVECDTLSRCAGLRDCGLRQVRLNNHGIDVPRHDALAEIADFVPQ